LTLPIIFLMRSFYGFLLVCGLTLSASQASFAQDGPAEEVPEVASPVASVDTAADLVKGWRVSPHRNKNGISTGACVMAATFDNGVELEFKGEEGQLTALRINGFRNDPYTIGQVLLGLEGQMHGLQSRIKSHQIDSSLLTVPAPAQSIMGVGAFSLVLGDQDYEFLTRDFSDGYDELNRCVTRLTGVTIPVVSEALLALPAADGDLGAMMPSQPLQHVNVDQLVPVPVPAMTDGGADGWRAEKGERLQDVLVRWTQQEGVALHADLTQNPLLREDFYSSGSLEGAVSELLSSFATMGNTAVGMQSDGALPLMPSTVSAAPQPQMMSNQPVSQSQRRWRALQGTNLRKVLQRWSVREGIDFVWDSDQEFYVRNSLNKQGDFNGAVSALLAQYTGEGTSPRAALNTDPETGMTSLIISVDKIAK